MSITGAGLLAMKRLATNGTLGAIGEIVDNSLQYSNSDVNIEVAFVQTDERIEHVIISDNGHGISDQIIDKCLWFGAGENFGAKKGIGKFGIGLPFACCSQSGYYEVISWQGKGQYKRVYRRHADWGMNDLIDDAPHELVKKTDLSEMIQVVCKKLLNNETGTIVVWNDCDNLDFKKGKTLVNHLERDLSRLYRFYIDNGANISLNIYNKSSKDSFDRLRLDDENSRKLEFFDPLFLRQSPLTAGHFSGPTSDPWFEGVTRLFEFKGHKFEITASLVKEEVQKPEGNKSRGGKTPLGQLYERNMYISLVRANRELRMNHFGFFKSQSDPRARWWKVEVKFEPISDEILGVNSNKTDASHFKYIDKKHRDPENDSNELMYNLGLIVKEAISDMMKLIKDRGKVKPGGVRCTKEGCSGLVVDGTCDSCSMVYENCPKCSTLLNSDGSCNSCLWITPRICPVHRAEYTKDGYCPSCGPVEDDLTSEEKEEIKNTLRSYPRFEKSSDEELEALFKWFISSGKRYFLLFAENPVDDSQLFLPKSLPKKSFNLVIVNTSHNFYKNIISKVQETLLDQGESEMQSALDAIIMLFISWSKLELNLSIEGGVEYNAVKDFRSDIGREIQRVLDRY